MYYVSSMKRDGQYGITDTTDGVEEFFTAKYIYDKFYTQGIKIAGVFFADRNKPMIRVKNPRSLFLDNLEGGTPIRVRLSETIGWKQAIYMGIKGDTYYFYDGSGVTGKYGLSEKFLAEHINVKFDTKNNNVVHVATLLKQMKSHE